MRTAADIIEEIRGPLAVAGLCCIVENTLEGLFLPPVTVIGIAKHYGGHGVAFCATEVVEIYNESIGRVSEPLANFSRQMWEDYMRRTDELIVNALEESNYNA